MFNAMTGVFYILSVGDRLTFREESRRRAGRGLHFLSRTEGAKHRLRKRCARTFSTGLAFMLRTFWYYECRESCTHQKEAEPTGD